MRWELRQTISNILADYDVVSPQGLVGRAEMDPQFLQGEKIAFSLCGHSYLLQYDMLDYAKTLFTDRQKDKTVRFRFCIFEHGEQIGEIARIRQRTGFLKSYNYLALRLNGVDYQLYKIGLGKQGIKCPIYCGQRQIAQINKGTIVKNNLDEYTLLALDEAAAVTAVFFGLYMDTIYYANRNEYVRNSTSVHYETTLNKDLMAWYDPAFEARC